MTGTAVGRIVHTMNDTAGKSGETGSDAATMVALLSAVDGAEQHTQRSLASQLDMALGLANALLRRCVSKGLIKIQTAPARRYAYYLTPKGFAEKSRLVAEYLATSLNFFRHARCQYEDSFQTLLACGITKVAIAGNGELAEIALLSASSVGVTITAVIAPGRNIEHFHGHPVVANLDAAIAAGAEAVVIADSTEPQQIYDQLIGLLGQERLIAPRLLHITLQNTPSQKRERAA
ncbi:MarR family transcriptional regulator [Ferrovibrio sp.]|uniref:MarR family transcriptional regulator n=1 Tax=Ferrovibrio sp. TaxID=1917215 RepID=UPI0035AF0449